MDVQRRMLSLPRAQWLRSAIPARPGTRAVVRRTLGARLVDSIGAEAGAGHRSLLSSASRSVRISTPTSPVLQSRKCSLPSQLRPAPPTTIITAPSTGHTRSYCLSLRGPGLPFARGSAVNSRVRPCLISGATADSGRFSWLRPSILYSAASPNHRPPLPGSQTSSLPTVNGLGRSGRRTVAGATARAQSGRGLPSPGTRSLRFEMSSSSASNIQHGPPSVNLHTSSSSPSSSSRPSSAPKKRDVSPAPALHQDFVRQQIEKQHDNNFHSTSLRLLHTTMISTVNKTNLHPGGIQ